MFTVFAAAANRIGGGFLGAVAPVPSAEMSDSVIYGIILSCIFVFSVAWAIVTLVGEQARKRKLIEIDAEANRAARREKGLPEEMEEADRQAVEARCLIMESGLNKEYDAFAHQADLTYACKALAECRALLPTDPELVRRLNAVSMCCRGGLTRVLLLWHAGLIGQVILIGGGILAVIATICMPVLGIFFLVPMLLLLLFGQAPASVLINPNPVDSVITVTLASFLGAAGGAFASTEDMETVWVDRWSNRVVAREYNLFGVGLAIALGILLLLIAVFFLAIRVEVLFLRNYVIYR